MNWLNPFKARLTTPAAPPRTANARLTVTALEDRLTPPTYSGTDNVDDFLIAVDGSSPTGISVKINGSVSYPDREITIIAGANDNVVIGDFYGYPTRVNII